MKFIGSNLTDVIETMDLALDIEVLDFQDDEGNIHHVPRNCLESRKDNSLRQGTMRRPWG